MIATPGEVADAVKVREEAAFDVAGVRAWLAEPCRLGVIAQQIYDNGFHGQTTHKAYAPSGPAARHLEHRCRSIIGR